MSDLCRLCLGKDNVHYNVFGERHGDLRAKIHHCVPVRISRHDGLPQQICQECFDKISDIYAYRQSTARNHVILVKQAHSGKTQRLQRPLQGHTEPADATDTIKQELPEHHVQVYEDGGKEEDEEMPGLLDDSVDIADDTCGQEFFKEDHDGVEKIEFKEELQEGETNITAPEISRDYDVSCSSDDDVALSLRVLKPREDKERKRDPDFDIEEELGIKKKVPSKKRGWPKGTASKEKKQVKKKVIRKERVKPGDYNVEEDKFVKRNYPGRGGDTSLWKCLMCLQHMDSRVALVQHYRDHVKVTPQAPGEEEGQTGEIKRKEPQFAVVESEQFGTNIAYQCLQCHKLYRSKRYVSHHLYSHIQARPFPCRLCGKAFKKPYLLLLHGRIHNGVKTLACQEEGCHFSSMYQKSLAIHMGTHQPVLLKYNCEICRKGFQSLTMFQQHHNVHSGEKPFVCDICGKGFFYSSSLQTHRRLVHTKAYSNGSPNINHRCPHCSVEFLLRKQLTQHVKVRHGPRAPPLLCDVCGKSLSSSAHLKKHRRVHTGEKPHKCRICDKSFKETYSLRTHEKTHSGEKPHVCSHCGKSFSQKSSLTVHERFHSGVRPYKCGSCDKEFVAQGFLTAHLKTCNQSGIQTKRRNNVD